MRRDLLLDKDTDRSTATEVAQKRHRASPGAVGRGTRNAWTNELIDVDVDIAEGEVEDEPEESQPAQTSTETPNDVYERVLRMIEEGTFVRDDLSAEERALAIEGWRETLSDEDLSKCENYNTHIRDRCYAPKPYINDDRVHVSAEPSIV